MVMRPNAAVILLLLLVSQSSAQSSADLSSTYQFSAKLHERYTLFWSINNDAQTIRFAVRVRTTGWVGFGLSPNGQMPQSDVVIGWVDSAGRSYFDVSRMILLRLLYIALKFLPLYTRIDLLTPGHCRVLINSRTGF